MNGGIETGSIGGNREAHRILVVFEQLQDVERIDACKPAARRGAAPGNHALASSNRFALHGVALPALRSDMESEALYTVLSLPIFV